MSIARGELAGYVQLDINLLQADTTAGFDIYIWPEHSPVPVLYHAGTARLDDDHRVRLEEAGTTDVYIKDESEASLHEYVEMHLDKIIADDRIPTGEKAKILYDASLRMAEEVLDQPETHENLKRSETLVRNTISYVLLGKDAFHKLLALKAYDYRTYTHSVNVCAIGLSLAERLGFSSEEELMAFGVGAIFHDVGKTRIPQHVLMKGGPLTDAEWREIKKHPVTGTELISVHKEFPTDAKAVVLEHHEWMDGGGYPDGKRADDIHPFAKVAALVDVYDALTSKRAYKDAVDTYPALKMMKEEVGTHFPDEYYRELVKLLGE